MQALVLKNGVVNVVADYPEPHLQPGWAMIHPSVVGVCRTDIELTRGYMEYEGVLGHEFVGTVAQCDDSTWIGQRVVGEINAACGHCDWCAKGLGRHCPNRKTLGIAGLDGCMAEYCTLPIGNLHRVPDEISNDAAAFIEPLSAAYEILEQVEVTEATQCTVIGDGKLGILCAWVLSTVTPNVRLVGHHEDKLRLAEWNGIATSQSVTTAEGSDLIVEASGRPSGFEDAMAACQPRGTIVLKSTIATQGELNLAPVVINELTVVGSRCGLFKRGLEGYVQHKFPLERLVSERYPLTEALRALQAAEREGALKVLIDVG